MADWTYNTDHGRFLLRQERLKELTAQLGDLDTFMGRHGLECVVDSEGNVVDVYMTVESWGNVTDGLKALAPYVEAGSYLVFYGGGSNGCWMASFDAVDSVVQCVEHDGVFVSKDDIRKLLQQYNLPDAARMEWRYGVDKED